MNPPRVTVKQQPENRATASDRLFARRVARMWLNFTPIKYRGPGDYCVAKCYCMIHEYRIEWRQRFPKFHHVIRARFKLQPLIPYTRVHLCSTHPPCEIVYQIILSRMNNPKSMVLSIPDVAYQIADRSRSVFLSRCSAGPAS